MDEFSQKVQLDLWVLIELLKDKLVYKGVLIPLFN
jgi:hypothetical protein